MTDHDLWQRYRKYLWSDEALGLRLDVSRMNFAASVLDDMAEPMARALEAMQAIEKGAKANIGEGRRVGHYWLRAADLAPDASVAGAIGDALAKIRRFAADVHEGRIRPQRGDGFYIVLVIGIGGSALGPQLVCDALGGSEDPMAVLFLDNTDPDGFDRVLAEIDQSLPETLTVVISKSGGTKETRNGMLEVAAAYKRAGLSFPHHAVAVTGEGSELDKRAAAEKWLAVFPMWDWVGGRTSVTSPVGLLAAALLGFDIDGFLAGAAACDEATRNRDIRANPAALMALMWHYAGAGRGERNMVVLPYRDRLLLLSRYLQQLVMESLGKSCDRAGRRVAQGLTVYGNKGSTDQHAFVQQLLDGRNDFFVTFVQVLKDRESRSLAVEPDVTSGDYLAGFILGTRDALYENGRESLTITLDELNAHRLGALIALFERAVGLYAELIDVDAYDQPGVEGGKKAAAGLLDLQRRVLALLRSGPGRAKTAEELAVQLAAAPEAVFHILEHAAANPDHGVKRIAASDPAAVCYKTAEVTQ